MVGVKSSCEALLGQGLHRVCKHKKSVLLCKVGGCYLAPEDSGEPMSPCSEHVHIHTPNLRSQIPLAPLRALNVGHLVRLCSFIPLCSSAMLAVRCWTLVPEGDKGVHKHCLGDPLNLRVLRTEAFKEANKS